jgi:signal transduction histidine kinase
MILVVVGVSLMITIRQKQGLRSQEEIAHSLELGARELSYLSNDFLLHGESQQRLRWEKRFSSFSQLLTDFSPNSPEIASLIQEIKTDQERLRAIFAEVASALENSHSNGDHAGYLAMIRVSWSRMEVQNQGIAFSASQIDRMLEEQTHRLQQRRVILLFMLIAVFGAFLVINFVIVNRRILLALEDLQEKTRIVGSGNLELVIEVNKADEIGDLSRAFNRMTADLRAVTASKTDLEQEIRERRQAETALAESETKYKNLFENMTEEVHFWQVVRDEGGDIRTWQLVDANPPTLKSWGRMTVEEIRGKSSDEIFGPGATEHYLPIIQKIMSEGIPHSFEDYFPHLDKYFRFTSVPLGDHFITTGADITDHKRAEEALKRSNQELQQFAYVASHDLQEPLRVIIGFLQLLQDKYDDRIDEKGRHYIERTVKAGHRMQAMIRDLLELSRVSNKGSKFVPTDLNHVVRDILENLQTIIQEKQADIVCAELPTLEVDSGQMRSLFQNLILNGLRYNENPRPVIEIGSFERDNVCSIFVRDNGIGISTKFHERIFMVFQRLHTEREYAGTGMGLALCKKIVERHGGTIRVESKPNEGATFYVALPGNRAPGYGRTSS